MAGPAFDPALRQSLYKAKLKSLVRGGWGDVVDDGEEGFLPGGAALVVGGAAFVLAEEQSERSLGAALTWAGRHAPPDVEVHLLATGAAGVLARRAALFHRRVVVYRVDGTSLREAKPEPLAPQPPLDPRAESLRTLFEELGAESVVEEGILRAEVRGLEVARVEIADDGPRVAVGVGKHDREAHREVKGEAPQDPLGPAARLALFEVIRLVAEHRVAGGFGHAAYHLAPERWLRSVVVRRPELVAAARLAPVPPPVVRHDLRQVAPAPAAGAGYGGEQVLVVCSVGVDVDLVPAAADAWLADGRQANLVFCLPEGDDHPVTRDLVEALAVPTEVRTVPEDWRIL